MSTDQKLALSRYALLPADSAISISTQPRAAETAVHTEDPSEGRRCHVKPAYIRTLSPGRSLRKMLYGSLAMTVIHFYGLSGGGWLGFKRFRFPHLK